MLNERYLEIISANGQRLSSILHSASGDTGVLLIVGGPQYRVGSHRQFVKLSRALMQHDIPSLRVDTTGMGDSEGVKPAFYQQTADINTAIAAFFSQQPQLKRLVLWGLCDAASAILLKMNQPDPRIAGLVLLNPWVRQQQSHAKTMLKHYYVKRLFSRQFWQKALTGGLALGASIKGLLSAVKASRANTVKDHSAHYTEQNYVSNMLSGWQQANCPSLLISSGNDLTAQEFMLLCNENASWQTCLQHAQQHHIALATHTFSSADWRHQVEQATAQFVLGLPQTAAKA